MWESFFGFKKTPFSDRPDAKQLFASAAWQQVKTRLELLTQHPGVGLLTGEVGAGKSTAARIFATSLNPSLYKILYIHFTNGSALDLLRQIALALDLEPAHFRGDLVRQISDASDFDRPGVAASSCAGWLHWWPDTITRHRRRCRY